jgi:hypothetical protein
MRHKVYTSVILKMENCCGDGDGRAGDGDGDGVSVIVAVMQAR